jgi:hypothetical protein
LAEGCLYGSEYRLYVVGDRETTLYVGQTFTGIASRLEEHVNGSQGIPDGNLYAKNPSALGRLIRDQAPTSDAWTVDLYKLRDCREIVKKHFPKVDPEDFTHATLRRWRIGVLAKLGKRPSGPDCTWPQIPNQRERITEMFDTAEQALILEHHPPLNLAHNPHRRPLPEKYRHALPEKYW